MVELSVANENWIDVGARHDPLEGFPVEIAVIAEQILAVEFARNVRGALENPPSLRAEFEGCPSLE